MNLKYSIIIPTRNGIDYLPFAIQSVLSQSNSNFELIVSDNHSTDGTWEYLKSINDQRLIRIQPHAPLSMVKHFEFVLTKPKGEWVSLIGDDDALQPYFFELANNLTSQYPNYSIISGPRAYYFWEGSQTKPPYTVMSLVASQTVVIKKSRKELNDLLFGESAYFDSPQFYVGTIFKKHLIDLVKSRQQDMIFNSITPDANSVVAILKNTNNFVYSGFPLAWIGTSQKSTGFSSTTTNVLKKNSKNDYVNLNLKDKISANPNFPFLIELVDPQLLFLEALYQNNLLYKPFLFRLYETKLFKYFVFSKVYSNYSKKKQINDNFDQGYLEVFNAHSLNIHFLKVVNNFFKILKKGNTLYYRLINKIYPSKIKKQVISKSSEDRHTFPSIANASKLSLDVYLELKSKYK